MSDQARKTAPETTFEQLWATLQENAQRQKETDREIKAVNQAIGNLGNRLGSLIEHLVSSDMHRKFNAYAFTRTNTRVICKDAHDKTLAEVINGIAPIILNARRPVGSKDIVAKVI